MNFVINRIVMIALVWLVVGQNAMTFAMEQCPKSPLVKKLVMPGSPNHGRQMKEVHDAQTVLNALLGEMLIDIAADALKEEKGQSSQKRKSLPFGLKSLRKKEEKTEDNGSTIRLSKEEFAKVESQDEQYNNDALDKRVERWMTGVLNNPEYGQRSSSADANN